MAGTACCFTDEQFREACAELQKPALTGADWQLLVEASGITIYRLLDQVAADPPAGGVQGPGPLGQDSPRVLQRSAGMTRLLRATLPPVDLTRLAGCPSSASGHSCGWTSELLFMFYSVAFAKNQKAWKQGIVVNGSWLKMGRRYPGLGSGLSLGVGITGPIQGSDIELEWRAYGHVEVCGYLYSQDRGIWQQSADRRQKMSSSEV